MPFLPNAEYPYHFVFVMRSFLRFLLVCEFFYQSTPYFAESSSISLNVCPHLRMSSIKFICYSPILEIPVIPLKQRRRIKRLRRIVVEKCVLETKRPVEFYISRVAVRKFLCLEYLAVLVHEALSECWPSEKVDCNGMFGSCLSRANVC